MVDAGALQRCVGDVETFLDRYWARQPFLREPAQDAGAFDDLASLDDLDHMVASLGLKSSSLRMVKDGKTLPVAAYTSTAGKRSRGGEPRISPARVYDLFADGSTIVLESLHRYWKPLTDFCRDLELSLGHRLQVNAYVTPPGSRGFDVHRDEHDVFVLQVSGAKHWVVYDRADEDLVLIDEELRPGSTLYIPRGFPHAATAGPRASAHLTVGILTHDATEIVRQITKLAEDEPAFQERLDLRDAAVDDIRATVVRAVDELRTFLDKVDIDELTERVARRVLSTSQPILTGQVAQLALLETIDEDTEVARRSHAVCVLFPKGTRLKVLLADRQLEMPIAAEPAMREIARRERLRPRDLHRYLTPESSVVLVRRLVREGLLEVVVGR